MASRNREGEGGGGEEVGRTLDDYHALDYLDKPLCPYCERELGVAPGGPQLGSISFKCTRHGRFPHTEFEANPLDVMKRRDSGPGIDDMVGALLLIVPFLAARALASKLQSAGRWFKNAV